jgi:hypothetical protein
MPRPQNYKDAITDALESMDEAAIHTFTAVVAVAMAGPYKEISGLHEIGEIMQLEPDMFRNTGDINIDTILKVMDCIQEARATLINLNGITLD